MVCSELTRRLRTAILIGPLVVNLDGRVVEDLLFCERCTREEGEQGQGEKTDHRCPSERGQELTKSRPNMTSVGIQRLEPDHHEAARVLLLRSSPRQGGHLHNSHRAVRRRSRRRDPLNRHPVQ